MGWIVRTAFCSGSAAVLKFSEVVAITEAKVCEFCTDCYRKPRVRAGAISNPVPPSWSRVQRKKASGAFASAAPVRMRALRGCSFARVLSLLAASCLLPGARCSPPATQNTDKNAPRGADQKRGRGNRFLPRHPDRARKGGWSFFQHALWYSRPFQSPWWAAPPRRAWPMATRCFPQRRHHRGCEVGFDASLAMLWMRECRRRRMVGVAASERRPHTYMPGRESGLPCVPDRQGRPQYRMSVRRR